MEVTIFINWADFILQFDKDPSKQKTKKGRNRNPFAFCKGKSQW